MTKYLLMADLLQEVWTSYRADIDSALEAYLDLGPNCPEQLQEAMAYSVMAGGKRLRPLLVLLACEACGGKAVDALPPYHRAVIIMREIEGMSYAEMAKTMNVSKGTIMSRLHHARQKLQHALSDYLEGDMVVK